MLSDLDGGQDSLKAHSSTLRRRATKRADTRDGKRDSSLLKMDGATGSFLLFFKRKMSYFDRDDGYIA